MNINLKTDWKTNFGKNLKTCRTAAGHTQAVIAEMTGVDFTYISKLENSASLPSLELLIQISIIYGKTLDELLSAPNL